MPVCALGYAVVDTEDLPAWSHFATEILGLMPAPAPRDGVALFRMDDRPFRFWVQRNGASRAVRPGWECASHAAFEATLQRLRDAGRDVTMLSDAEARQRYANAVAVSSDPAGHGMELYWGRYLDYAPFVSPAGVSGFVTGMNGEFGLGHIVLAAPNFAETHAFYKDVLGLSDTDLGRFYLAGGGADDPGVGFAFLHAHNSTHAARHHSLALGELPESGGPVHLMVEVAGVDDVGRALDRAAQQKRPLSATLGRHVNDKMLSFYVKAPSGFDIEYGTGGLLIDPATWVPTTSLPVSAWGHVWQYQQPDT